MWEKSEQDTLRESIRAEIRPSIHYHGDTVRKLFLVGGVVMISTLPFVYSQLNLRLEYSIVAIIILVISAGITNPLLKKAIIFDSAVSALAFCIFEYFAVRTYVIDNRIFFALLNQILALNFLLALYYSIRTLRWLMTHNGLH